MIRFLLEAAHPDFRMGWNLSLAISPLLLSIGLFRTGRWPSILWWPTLVVFLLFLPNAAYVLTDVLHLVHEIRHEPYLPVWIVSLVTIPQFALFMLAGFESYVLSLLNLGHFLGQRGRAGWVLPIELTIHFLSAVGIYWGRFQRANSWDAIADPQKLSLDAMYEFTHRWPLLITLGTFAILVALYYPLKFIDLAIVERSANSLRRKGGWDLRGQPKSLISGSNPCEFARWTASPRGMRPASGGSPNQGLRERRHVAEQPSSICSSVARAEPQVADVLGNDSKHRQMTDGRTRQSLIEE